MFDFLGCRVSGGESAPGQPLVAGDPTLGLAVVGTADRSSAKMVDLDPEWQASSQIWGLSVRLVDPASGEEMLSGSFRVTAFRDLWPRQTAGAAVNGQAAAGSFTSVLDEVVLGPGCAASAVLDALRRASPTPRLSIVLNLFGFFYNHVEDRFDPAVAAPAAQQPLGLLARLPDGRRRVVCRETLDGLYLRADEFVHRIDAGTAATTTLHAVRRGEPAAGVPVHLGRERARPARCCRCPARSRPAWTAPRRSL